MIKLNKCLVATQLLFASLACAQNYDESKVGEYELPPLLVSNSGADIQTPEQWTALRRPEVLELFRPNVYGRTPSIAGNIQFDVISTNTTALQGLATRNHIRITVSTLPAWQGIEMMLYHPNNVSHPAPVILGLNFFGNHSITTETDVPLSDRWMRPEAELGIVNNRATEASRGTRVSKWPLEMLLQRGYAVGTAYYGDVEPDHADGWQSGLRGYVRNLQPGGPRPPDDWGAIGAWAWELTRMLDYCTRDTRLDAARSMVIGHSRLGKAALWAAAQDQRFGMVVSNNSGEGGAALARRNFGETISIMTNGFPHWFSPIYGTFAGREDELPVDQHMLIALMAPRPAYIASASEDLWADPRGEFLSGVHAGDVYALFGKVGLGTDVWPQLNFAVGESIGYHRRHGAHDITTFDWTKYLDFADRHFSPSSGFEDDGWSIY